ncbi:MULTISPECIES: exodeoxyribonuclease V subunit beta [Pseudomonas]|uniref:RecBCD enzyme subunit RecB n=2 Tax=Gammaproteobacteria TaxID=1236 RepID=A0A7W2LZT0_9PSED|nr:MULTISPECIES: exodeoxyribonuclease V subunit beta [Pseudomonas]MBA6134417.1 exodeoxyribonuclease V subunit beta [Pseudomonas juntendi]MBA6150061.1 exodeoxyribonuclease V subunit beta [Pseudomonas juntendi]MCK2112967.1 exodeoxyribonuclease V subunit beta [Pseudomonas juntendi]MCK2117848.1 exodeoxyribonuclease V subunit beta [Pseudomonas juntendi]MDG9811517.1 exodeoxyribonuclease V subunit beta [Pseudomonas juntendi]
MTQARPLALSFPLHGSQLIEASAGTGKTFTISALYLRLILGHGGEQGFARELLPPQILVVTFTDAATKELRERIRARLAEAARFFRGELEGADPLLHQLRDDYPQEAWPRCAGRLEIAVQWMDEAAVSTIHGWCQRMLREHAFDSGSLFTQTLETDHSELLGQVMRDYWRRFCYSMQGQALAWVRSHWVSPDALLPRIRPLFGRVRAEQHGAEPAALIEASLQQRSEQLARLKAPWLQWAEELRQICRDALAAKQVDGRKMQARYFEPWFDKLHAWATDEQQVELDLGTGFTRLTPAGMAEAWKGEPPAHPGLDAMQTLAQHLQALDSPDAPLLEHAANWVSARFEVEKRRRAEMGFDDMLVRLQHALASEAGERLGGLIREQFPVALIDEFQDTDPVQYGIFERIYQIGENRPDTGLFMIGDPKQAIYAFRGADIYTYLAARRATIGRLHSLDTNYRSSKAMVAAVNQVFLQAEARQGGRGAFLFRGADDNPLPFIEVHAKGRSEQLVINGEASAALQCWQLQSDEPVSGSVYRQQLAASCASHIVDLLNGGQQGTAGFRSAEGELRPCLPSDIAILVRDGHEAQLVRAELAARDVRSVYLSDKDSVFAAQEAHDLLAWLKACAEPDSERLLKAALASLTLGLSLPALDRLNQDERVWEGWVMRFRYYRETWQRQGVLPMLRHLLHDFQLPRTLIRRSDGERVLTNLLHLAELLQQAAGELDGEQALIRHLAEHLASSGQAGEDQILRLESDEQLVKVVTIHKSKGLEYPLVYLPFICTSKPVDGSRLPLAWHDPEGHAHLTLTPGQEQIERADDERLAEDLRLLYVALTRAQHACWLGVADLKRGNQKTSQLHRSALGYLLGGGLALASSAQLADWLQALAAGCPHIACPGLPPAQHQVYRMPHAERELLPARKPRRAAAEHWWIASYSALRVGDQTLGADSSQAQQLQDDEVVDVQVLREVPADSGDIHRFPRGPNPGTFLHGLLEWAGREGFSLVSRNPQLIERTVGQRCNRRDWTGWIPTLSQWMQRLLSEALPLPGSGQSVTLGELCTYQIEMEFWFASQRVDAEQLDRLVARHTHPGLARPAAQPTLLNGMFKGFIDLAFELDGRYYVTDYKSNWLGPDTQAYDALAMEKAILEHRYDLQYVLYLLALHRQLRARLPDYDYDRHVGGALFIFLRGASSSGHGVYFTKPPRELIESLDALFRGEHPPTQQDLFAGVMP